MKKSSKLSIVAMLAAASVVLTGCASSGDSPETPGADGLIKVTLAHDSTAAAAAVSLGIEQGFFEAEGLEVEHKGVGAPPAIVAAVQSNEADFGSIPSIVMINALSQGVELVAVSSDAAYPADVADLTPFDTNAIYVNPDSGITRPKDLEGKDVAVPARKAVFEVLIADAIVRDGGDPSTVNWIVLDFGSQVAALEDGRVDAAGLVLPFSVQAGDNGATFLNHPGIKFYEQGPINLWIASPKAAQDAELMAKVQRAINKSNAYANDNVDAAKARAAELTGIDPALLEKATGFPYSGTQLDLADLERTNKNLTELGFLEKPVDLTNRVFVPTK